MNIQTIRQVLIAAAEVLRTDAAPEMIETLLVNDLLTDRRARVADSVKLAMALFMFDPNVNAHDATLVAHRLRLLGRSEPEIVAAIEALETLSEVYVAVYSMIDALSFAA